MKHLNQYKNFHKLNEVSDKKIASNKEIQAYEQMEDAIINYIKEEQNKEKYTIGIFNVLDDNFSKQDWKDFHKLIKDKIK